MLLLSLNLGSQLRGTTTTHGDSRARLSVRPRGRLQYSLMPTGNPEVPPAAEPVSPLYDTRLPRLSRWRRMQIPLIASTAIAIIRGLGPTLRFEKLGHHHYEQSRARAEPVISAFWHRCIISAIWYWRNRGVVVMNTTNFDGQWTRRVIEHFGFGTAQGSSTRGGLRGLAVLARRLDEGFDTAFTIDGPRGPRYVAKPGPVMLARRTGRPLPRRAGCKARVQPEKLRAPSAIVCGRNPDRPAG